MESRRELENVIFDIFEFSRYTYTTSHRHNIDAFALTPSILHACPIAFFLLLLSSN